MFQPSDTEGHLKPFSNCSSSSHFRAYDLNLEHGFESMYVYPCLSVSNKMKEMHEVTYKEHDACTVISNVSLYIIYIYIY